MESLVIWALLLLTLLVTEGSYWMNLADGDDWKPALHEACWWGGWFTELSISCCWGYIFSSRRDMYAMNEQSIFLGVADGGWNRRFPLSIAALIQ